MVARAHRTRPMRVALDLRPTWREYRSGGTEVLGGGTITRQSDGIDFAIPGGAATDPGAGTYIYWPALDRRGAPVNWSDGLYTISVLVQEVTAAGLSSDTAVFAGVSSHADMTDLACYAVLAEIVYAGATRAVRLGRIVSGTYSHATDGTPDGTTRSVIADTIRAGQGAPANFELEIAYASGFDSTGSPVAGEISGNLSFTGSWPNDTDLLFVLGAHRTAATAGTETPRIRGALHAPAPPVNGYRL